MHFDAIIIGGGAAGLFCAITAGRRGKRVLVIEHNAEVGRKILISGGGRCNFTNKTVGHENFLSQNPHFCKSALSRFTPQDFIELVKQHKIAYYEKTLGQLFCRDSSRQIIDMLLEECRRAKVKIATSCRVDSVSSPHVSKGSSEGSNFVVSTSQGVFSADSLIVACGGFSFPKVGATSFGFKLALQFGHTIEETRPSLVAMMANEANVSLAGVSFDAAVDVGKHIFREKVLFTHRGFSGPAILQASNYWIEGKPISVDMLPDNSIRDLIKQERGRKETATFLGRLLPQRLADAITDEIGIGKRPVAELNAAHIDALESRIHNWQINFYRTEGYGRAEVTLGGVSTKELSSQTMESKRVTGLYFIGEVVDVTGWLGGYNFQWAWASGHAAGASL